MQDVVDFPPDFAASLCKIAHVNMNHAHQACRAKMLDVIMQAAASGKFHTYVSVFDMEDDQCWINSCPGLRAYRANSVLCVSWKSTTMVATATTSYPNIEVNAPTAAATTMTPTACALPSTH